MADDRIDGRGVLNDEQMAEQWSALCDSLARNWEAAAVKLVRGLLVEPRQLADAQSSGRKLRRLFEQLTDEQMHLVANILETALNEAFRRMIVAILGEAEEVGRN